MGENLRIFISEGNNLESSDTGRFCSFCVPAWASPWGGKRGWPSVKCFALRAVGIAVLTKDGQFSQEPGNWQEFWGGQVARQQLSPILGRP